MSNKILPTDRLYQMYPKLNEAIDNAENALYKSTSAVNTADSAETKADSVQAQFNQVIIEGDSSVESAQARVAADGTTFTTLQERLNTNDEHVTDLAVNIKSFGAVGDGVTDNTQAFSDALDYLGANGGGRLLIPAGTWRGALKLGYDLTAAVMKEHHNITIEGVGEKTILTLDSSDVSPGGELIAIRGKDTTTKLKNITVRNLTVRNKEQNPNPGNGIGVTSSENILIENVWADSCTNYGITVEKNNENINIVNYRGTNNARSGLALTSDSTRRVKVVNAVCENNQWYGMYIAYNTGTTMEELVIIAPQCRYNVKAGIYCSHFDHSHIIGGIVSNNSEEGIVIHDTKGATISSTTIQNNNFEGIRLSMAKGCSVIGSHINDNAKTGTNKHGVRIHNLSDGNLLLGNTIRNISGTSQDYGIRLDGDGNTIMNNMLEGNGFGTVSIGSSFTNNIVDGYNMNSNVSGSIPSNTRKKMKGVSAPTAGTFVRGDIIENLLPSAGGNAGWICVADGTPGTWKTYGSIGV